MQRCSVIPYTIDIMHVLRIWLHIWPIGGALVASSRGLCGVHPAIAITSATRHGCIKRHCPPSGNVTIERMIGLQ